MANDVIIDVKTKGTKKAKSQFGDLTKGAAKLGLAFGALKIVKFGLDAVSAFSDLEESVNAVTVVYEDQAGAIARLGENSAEAFGLTTTEVNDAAVSMGAFVEKINEADPADAFTNIIQRATDFASVMNIDTSEALDKFRAGLSGESEPLKRFGINVSEANIKLFALETGLIQAGEVMDDATKTQARFGFIMQETEKTAGDFANTSDGLAGSQKILTAKWKEAQIELGEKLAPVMLALLEAGVSMIPIFSRVVLMIGDLVPVVVSVVDALTNFLAIMGDWGTVSEEAADGTDSWLKALLAWRPLGESARDIAEEAANNIDELSGSTLSLRDNMSNLVPPMEQSLAEIGAAGRAARGAAAELGIMSKSTKDLRDEIRRLADPVFNAERAFDDLQAAIDATLEDGRTQEEVEGVARALGDWEAAEAAIGNENIGAAVDLMERAGILLGEDVEAVEEWVSAMDSVTPERLSGFIEARERLEKLTREPLQFQVQLTAPSQGQIRNLMITELNKLRREGVIPATGF